MRLDAFFGGHQLTPADIHPVALNVLNQQRDGRFLIPSPGADLPVLAGNGTFGRESLQQQVIPTELRGLTVQGGRTVEVDLTEAVPTRDELALQVVVSRGRLGATVVDSLALYWDSYQVVEDSSPVFDRAYAWLRSCRPEPAARATRARARGARRRRARDAASSRTRSPLD